MFRLTSRLGPILFLKRSHPFEGILPNLSRRFRETDSAAVREDLVRYQSAKPCPDCEGSRLRREAMPALRALSLESDAAGASLCFEVNLDQSAGETATAKKVLEILRSTDDDR